MFTLTGTSRLTPAMLTTPSTLDVDGPRRVSERRRGDGRAILAAALRGCGDIAIAYRPSFTPDDVVGPCVVFTPAAEGTAIFVRVETLGALQDVLGAIVETESLMLECGRVGDHADACY